MYAHMRLSSVRVCVCVRQTAIFDGVSSLIFAAQEEVMEDEEVLLMEEEEEKERC
jgi:hypothetical protein